MKTRIVQQNNLPIKNINNSNKSQFNYAYNQQTSFKGNIAQEAYGTLTDVLAKGISKLVDNKVFLDLTKKVGGLKKDFSDSSFPSIIAAESLWLSAFYTISTFKNPKYEKKQKETEAVYQTLVTLFSAWGAFKLDSGVNDIMDNFTKTFEKQNEKLDLDTLVKCKNGIKLLKSIVIFTTIYRFVGPVVMSPFANKISGYFQNKADAKNEEVKKAT